uniref:CCHC-type domain-containing protein n=1 Tax=Nicotiana tabacum TaxID=4097 RepID=A0A1S3ZPP2_TOBAC|nr:PREDICTED: uncharacterized protein LOC107789075 [Nicotiana tabacum]
MKDGESVEEIFSRFSKILEDLKSLGRPIKSGEQPNSTRKKKTVSFKATIAESENEEEEEEHDENIAMLSQIVTSMMGKNRYSRRGRSNFRKGRTSNENDKNDGRCYECGKYGHIQADCPELKKKLSKNFQKKKSCGACSDEEEYDHEEIANMCFMVTKEDSNKDSDKPELMAENEADEEEDSDELCFMADKGTSEVRLPSYPNWYELQDFVDIALTEIEKVLGELRKIQREKKDWALKLEVCEIERDTLQDEVNELKLQLNGLLKSTSHSSVKSNQTVPHTSLIRTRNSLGCSYCGNNGHNTNQIKDNSRWVWRPKSISQANTQKSNHSGPKQACIPKNKLDGGTVTFGDKSKGNVIGVEKVSLSSTCDVDEVYLVEELGYNLLSISQLCDDDYENFLTSSSQASNFLSSSISPPFFKEMAKTSKTVPQKETHSASRLATKAKETVSRTGVDEPAQEPPLKMFTLEG